MREFCESILAKHVSEPAIKENNHAIIIEPNIEEENNHANNSEPATEGKNPGFSVLKDSCGLVRQLRENENRWEVIYEVWEELLTFAASHCRVDSHVRLLNEGSEFITSVWILMSLCGIGDQFPAGQQPVQ
ncbi:hypothetical protein MLD38_037015 [Melastoma candidum]|uniref:Uncharacterized protein n=1 Tax=Melastoma candidum TaxID=119954 RepID=A0ACB9LLI3_9MYRT|nr:hypothetical protein MLD38_037015 [Melastoma candidum]